MTSSFFVDRPIFAFAISAFVVIAGVMAFRELPVSLYPDILPPQVQVRAVYPGASAEVVAETVATPLEQSINGVDEMLYLNSSSSSNGQLYLTVTFKIGTDPDLAAIKVQSRVQAAMSQLPEEVRRRGVIVDKASSAILLLVMVYSPDNSRDSLFLSNYSLVNVVDELRRIRGIGQVQMNGAQDYAIRVWLQPDRLAQLGLTPSDVADAVREQNVQVAGGRVGDAPIDGRVDLTLSVTAQGRLKEPEDFGNVVLRAGLDGRVIRLRDVARLELGAQSYGGSASTFGKPIVALGVYLSPNSNALDVSEAVHQRMNELSKSFPAGVSWKIPYDTTDYVNESMREVAKTLLESMLLVFVVVYVFLQNWRATLIPALAVPISLLGALAAMHVFGFSINQLTMFGMVLAVGIVVDDAIVVVENVERHMRVGVVDSKEATRRAVKEVTGPVIAIVLVLTAVFLPVAFLGGLVGEMYRQFAITIVASVIISGIIALTLTPALCAVLLRPANQEGFLGRFDRWFQWVTACYENGVRLVMRHAVICTALLLAMLLATWCIYRVVPPSLAPEEDQGWVIAVTILPPAASLQRTDAAVQQLVKAMRHHPAIYDNGSLLGVDPLTSGQRTNTAISFFPLRHWNERQEPGLDAAAVVAAISKAGTEIRDAITLAINPPPIAGISFTGGFQAYVQSHGSTDYAALEGVVQRVVSEASKRKELAGVSSTYSAQVPRVKIELDRDRAKALGVPVASVFETLQSTFGAFYVNDFNRLGRVFKVQLQSDGAFRKHPEDIRTVFLRSESGRLIPLTALASIRLETGPDMIEHFNAFPSARLIGMPAPGYSSGQALATMERIAAEVLPEGYQLVWSGQSYQEKVSGSATVIVFVLAIVMAYLILAALYERLVLPLAIIMAVPFGLFGALLAVWLRGLSNDLYLQVGLITLIGLAAKNAILVVEFAAQRHSGGMSLKEAAIEAARLRFRPIIMTSLAFILGVLPLAVSSGAGAASRHSIGTGVVGGMLMATFLAILFLPLFFIWMVDLPSGYRSSRLRKSQRAFIDSREGK